MFTNDFHVDKTNVQLSVYIRLGLAIAFVMADCSYHLILSE
jgi:hypothetical protein